MANITASVPLLVKRTRSMGRNCEQSISASFTWTSDTHQPKHDHQWLVPLSQPRQSLDAHSLPYARRRRIESQRPVLCRPSVRWNLCLYRLRAAKDVHGPMTSCCHRYLDGCKGCVETRGAGTNDSSAKGGPSHYKWYKHDDCPGSICGQHSRRRQLM